MYTGLLGLVAETYEVHKNNLMKFHVICNIYVQLLSWDFNLVHIKLA